MHALSDGMIATSHPAPPDERFRRLFDAHYRSVLAYALRRCSTREDAQDAAAETLAVAWRRLDELRDEADALPWLYAIAGRVLANQRRAGRRLTALRTVLARQPAPAHDASAEWTPVLEALQRLRPRDQEILRLAAWEGLAHVQIAAVLGCTEDAVAVRLHRARKRLAAQLDDAPHAALEPDPPPDMSREETP